MSSSISDVSGTSKVREFKKVFPTISYGGSAYHHHCMVCIALNIALVISTFSLCDLTLRWQSVMSRALTWDG